MYGEGTKPQGAIYQLSNQVTLGISEREAIDNLKGIAAQIIREERAGREQWKQNPHFEDMVWRSLGLLRTARLLTGDEFMALMSNLRVGVAMGVIPGIPLETAGALINDVQPATLMAAAGRDMEPAERDALRARIVRERAGVSQYDRLLCPEAGQAGKAGIKSMYRFKGFTEKANNALNLAIESAQELGHTYIGTEHVVLGLLREGTGVAASVLGARGITAAGLPGQGGGGGVQRGILPPDAGGFHPPRQKGHGNGHGGGRLHAARLCGDGTYPPGGAAGRHQRGGSGC